MTRSRTHRFLVALLLLALASPLLAQTYPPPTDDIDKTDKDNVDRFVNLTKDTLNKLDYLVTDFAKKKDRAKPWRAECKLVLEKQAAFVSRCIDNRQGTEGAEKEAYDAVIAWYKLEFEQWNNIQSFGFGYMVLHDKLINQAHEIKDVELAAFKNRRAAYEVIAKGLELVAAAAESFDPTGSLEKLNVMISELDDGIKSAAIELLAESLRSEQKEIEGYLKTIDPDAMKRQVKQMNAFILADDDCPRRTLYRDHELKWEATMLKVYEAYEKVTTEYRKETFNIVKAKFLEKWTHLRAYAGKIDRLDDDLLKLLMEKRKLITDGK